MHRAARRARAPLPAPRRPRRRGHRRRRCRSSTTSGATTTPDWLRVIADGLSRDDPRVPSVTFLWKGAEWMEREAYDMFGIIFEGNRDLRRIYMPPDYQSFPLRKDFFLPDDAARSPGGGVRPMERTHSPDERRRRPRSSAGRRAERERPTMTTPTPPPTPPPTTRGSRSIDELGRLRADPAVPAAHRARGRVLHPRRRRDVHQHGSPAPLDPRRAAGRPQDRRRAGRRPRPGPGLPPPRRREAVRERRLPPGDQLHAIRSSTSARCSASGRRSWPSRSSSTSRCRAAPSTSGSSRPSSTGSPATPCSWAGSRSTSAA